MSQIIELTIDRMKFQCEIIDSQTCYIRRRRKDGSLSLGFTPTEINEGVWMLKLRSQSLIAKKMHDELKRHKKKYLAALDKLKSLMVYL